MTRTYSGVVIDLDGVCYRGGRAVAGSSDAVSRLRNAGIGVTFATNNSTRTPQDNVEKLASLGFEITPNEVVTSGVAAADLLDPGTRCMVIGADGLRAAPRARRCELVDDPQQTQAVPVGLDPQPDRRERDRRDNVLFGLRAGHRVEPVERRPVSGG